MLIAEISLSIDKIKSLLLSQSQFDMEYCNKIISEEVRKVLRLTQDEVVTKLISAIYFEWKNYSGQINTSFSQIKKRSDFEEIITNSNRILVYIKNNFKD